jgi:hypothetical protein
LSRRATLHALCVADGALRHCALLLCVRLCLPACLRASLPVGVRACAEQ